MAGLVCMTVFLFCFGYTFGQMTCTSTGVSYVMTSSVGYYSEPYADYYSCGFWGLSRCSRTRYRSRTRAVYAQSSVYHITCCPGYSGSGCQAVCSPNCRNGGTCSSPNVCSCITGWSGESCINDVDECAVNNGGCHHICHNTAGSFECRCNSGYSLASDGRTCNEPPSEPRNVNLSNVGQRSATVSWDPPTNNFSNPLTDVSAYRITASQNVFQEGNRVAIENEYSLTYQFIDLEEYTAYYFSVAASNSFGYGVASEQEEATTLQAAPSAAPLGVVAFSNSSYNITLCWSPPPEIDRNGVILYYQLNVTESETGAQFEWTSSELSATRDSLHPHYHYECRVAASTAAGTGPFSAVETVQPLPAAPTAAPTHVRVTSFDSTSISLAWEPPPFSDRNGDIVMYHITVTEQESETVSEYTSTSKNYTLTFLHPYYNYNISIAAETVEVGPFTSGLLQKTMESFPSSAPGNFSMVATSATSLFLSWDELQPADRNGVIREYTINLTNVVTGEDTEYSAVAGPYTITNLHPDYIYCGKVAAVTVVGAGPLSSPIEVKLPEAAPSGTPTNFSVDELFSRSVALSWQYPPEEDRNGVITGFKIQLSDSSNFNNYSVFETENITVSISEELKPFQKYYCKIAALTMAGVGPYTEAINFHTTEDVPSPVNMIVMTAVQGAPSELTVQWSPPVEPNGELVAYTVYCKMSSQQPLCDCDLGTTSPSCSCGDMALNVSYHQQAVLPVGLSHTEVIGGFSPYTNYTCFMTANTSAGESSPGTSLSAVTDESLPEDPPQNVEIFVINSTALHLSWRQPSIPNGVIVAYHVSYNVSTSVENTLDTNMTNVTVTGLDEYTVYKFVLHASTRIGNGPSTIILGQTDESYPHSPPRDIQVFNVGKRSVDVSWIPPLSQDHNGPLTHYEIRFIQNQFDSFPNVTVQSSNLSICYSELEEFTNYAVVVAASTSTGLGPFSSPVTFTTLEAAPSSAPLLGAGFVQSSSIVTFNWTAPLPIDQNGVIDYYNVIVTEVPTGREWFLVATDTQITLGSLHPYYHYSCVVAAFTVGIGPFSQPFFALTEEEAPTAPPSRPEIVSYSSNSISLTWESPPAEHVNGVLRHYTVVYLEQDTSLEFSATSNTTSLQLMDLHPHFTYVMRVRAETVSPGPFSDTQSVQLQEDVPSASVLDLSAQAVDPTTIIISWMPPLFIHQNGLIQSYRVHVNETNTGSVYNYSSTASNITVSQFHPYYTYSCAVSPVTVKPGPSSSPVYVTTHEDVPSGTVQDIEVQELHSQMVILQWQPPELEHQNGVIIHYLVEISLNDSLQITFSNTTGEVSNLTPYTNYQIRIAAATVVGVGPLSAPLHIRTEEDAPSSPPIHVEAVSLNSNTLSISWSPPQHTNGVIRGYTVTLLETDTLETITATTNQTSITLSFQIPSFTYVYTVAARTIALGPASPEMNITMPEDAPSGPPTNITAEMVGPNSVALTWSPPDKRARNGIIIGYVVKIMPFTSDNSSSLVTDSQRIDTVSLNPHTLYAFSVAAITAVGTGPFSMHLHVRTEETAPSSPPSNVTGNPVDSTTVVLSWMALLPAHHNGIIRYYSVNLTETDTGDQIQTESETTTKLLSSLHPYYTYKVAVAAVTVASGPYSTPVTFQLPEDAPSGPPTDFSAEALSSNSLQATWNPPPLEEQNGVITHYVVTITNLNDGVEIEDVVFNTSLVVSSLDPHTEYEVYVVAATAAGAGPPTTPLTLHTHEDAPTHGPSNLTVVDIGPTHIHIRWDHPPNDTHQGIVRQYNIYVDVEETQQTHFYTTTAENRELFLTSLHPYYTYHMRVTAVTVEEGNSTLLSARTHESAPSGTPQNIEVEVINSTSVNITWSSPLEQDTNGILRHFVINITKDAGETQLVTLSAQHLSYTARDLQPYTWYYISIAAVTVAIGPFSGEIPVEMPEAAPLLPPGNVSVHVLSHRQILVSWTPPEENTRNGLIRMYIINVTRVDSNEEYSETSNTTSISLSVLPFRYYFISVAAVTVEAGPFTDDIAVETPEDAPTAAPQDLQVSNVTSTTLALTWTEPDTEFHNGIIRHYTVLVLPVAPETESVSITTSNTTLEIFGLHPFTTYTISIAAFTVGLGPSENISVKTMESIPTGAPMSVTVEPINSTAIHVYWQPPLDVHINGVILNYVVKITKISSTLTVTYMEINEELLVGSLQPFSVYGVSVAVENSIGVGPFSSPEEVLQTLEDAPSAPRDVRFSNLTSTSVSLWWDDPPPGEHNGIIRSYEIEVTENDTGLVYHLTTTDMQYMFDSLHPDYWYGVQVQAVTVAVGEPSAQLIFKTLEDIPSGPPLNLSVYVQNSTHAVAMWEDPDQDQHNGVITHYVVKIIETDTLVTHPILTVFSPPLMLSDLHPYYTYQVQVAAATSIGVGPFTQLLAFRMDEAAPSSPPHNVTVEPASSTAILISWEPPAIKDQNGRIRSYNIIVSDAVTQTQTMYTVGSEHNQFLVDMLHPHRSYESSVAATTVATGVYSHPVLATTNQDVPSEAPSGVSGWALNSTSISVTWSPLQEDTQNGIIVHYSLQLIEVATGRLITAEINATSAVVSSLHSYYAYKVTVAAATIIGIGPFSEEIIILTYSDVPTGSPVDVEIESISSISVTIAWGQPLIGAQNGVILAYIISVANENELLNMTTNITAAYISQIIVSPLKPFSEYNLSVAAVNINGTGPFSPPTTFTTAQAAPGAPPVGLEAKNVSSRGVSLTWEPPPLSSHNGIIQEYKLRVIEISTSSEIYYTSLSTKMTLDNLHPHYDYQISVAAVTVDVGPNVTINITTLEEGPSGPPQQLQVLSVTSTNITLLWVPPSLQYQNGVIRNYTVNICHPNVDNCWTEFSTTTQYTVSGLHPFYTYHINVAAVTVDSGPPTGYRTVTCLEDAPSGPPTNVKVKVLSSSSLHIMWSEPEPESTNGVIRHYDVIVRGGDSILTSSVVDNELIVPLLTPYTDYECSVAAVTVQRGPSSTPVLAQTLQDAPNGPPLNISIEILSSSSINVSWSPPMEHLQNGVIKEYMLYIWIGDSSTTTLSNTSYAIIEHLHPHYTYNVAVAAVTVALGPLSYPSTFTMPQDAPSSGPQNVEAVSQSPYNIELHWDPPDNEHQNGDIVSYYISVTHIDSGEGLSFQVPGGFFSGNNFHPYYTYNITIYAVTIGIGPGTTVNITTLETAPSSPPLNVTTEVLSPTVARLTWQPPDPENRNGRIREYSIVRVTLPIGILHQLMTSSTEMVLDDLHPYTVYFVVIAARTVSLGPFSHQVFFNTPEAGPSGTVQNITLRVLSATSVEIRWLPPPTDSWNGIIRNYTIYVEHVESVHSTANSSQELHNLSFTQVHPSRDSPLYNNGDPHLVSLPLQFESIIISNIQESQVYQFSIVMANLAGWGEESLPIIQELPGSEPSGAPINIQIRVLSSSSVEVQWEPPSLIHHNGVISGYWVEVTDWGIPPRLVFNETTEKLSMVIEGLERYRCYYIVITAENSDGRGPSSIPIHFKTLEDVPSVPVNVSVCQVGITSVSVSWGVPEHPNGLIIGYMVWYAPATDRDDEMVNYTITVDAQHSLLTVENLTVGFSYTLKVRAETTPGFGMYSEEITIILDPYYLTKEEEIFSQSQEGDGAITLVSLIAVGVSMSAIIIIFSSCILCYITKKKKMPPSLTISLGNTGDGEDNIYDEIKVDPEIHQNQEADNTGDSAACCEKSSAL